MIAPKAKCAMCKKKPVDPAYRPFCCKRCADVDLGKWLKGSYVVPGEDGEAAQEAAIALDAMEHADDEGDET